QTDEAIGVRHGYIEHLLRALADVSDQAAGEKSERAANRREGRAQLMADRRNEFVFHAIDDESFGDVAERDDYAGRTRRRIEHRAGGVFDRDFRSVALHE